MLYLLLLSICIIHSVPIHPVSKYSSGQYLYHTIKAPRKISNVHLQKSPRKYGILEAKM